MDLVHGLGEVALDVPSAIHRGVPGASRGLTVVIRVGISPGDNGSKFDIALMLYRSGTVNSKTVNSKYHLIQCFFEIFAKFLSYHV